MISVLGVACGNDRPHNVQTYSALVLDAPCIHANPSPISTGYRKVGLQIVVDPYQAARRRQVPLSEHSPINVMLYVPAAAYFDTNQFRCRILSCTTSKCV
jgi:hypothetical protein